MDTNTLGEKMSKLQFADLASIKKLADLLQIINFVNLYLIIGSFNVVFDIKISSGTV